MCRYPFSSAYNVAEYASSPRSRQVPNPIIGIATPGPRMTVSSLLKVVTAPFCRDQFQSRMATVHRVRSPRLP
jgi:hypothetical protein